MLPSLVSLALCFAARAAGQTETVLLSFNLTREGSGSQTAGLALDQEGSLYGVTSGTSFTEILRLNSSGHKTLLHRFDTAVTTGTPAIDTQGNVYGTDLTGGAFGEGDIFRITPAGDLTELYSFQGPDGANPFSTLVFDSEGNLYGTTINGGGANFGTVFKLTPAGVFTTLYSFKGGTSDGANPGGIILLDSVAVASGPLALDKKGNLYGTTTAGGANDFGTVFQLTPAGVESLLVSIAGEPSNPLVNEGLVIDHDGNLYGTTLFGGLDIANGSVFRVSPKGIFKEIHAFAADAEEGEVPTSIVAVDAEGVLYGTTTIAGLAMGGTLYSLTSKGTFTLLHNFPGPGTQADGSEPYTTPVVDEQGNLYGDTTKGGRQNAGVVYRVEP